MTESASMDAFKHILFNAGVNMSTVDQKPFYYADRPDLLSWFPDKYMSMFVPVAIYWICAIPFDILDYFSPAFLEKYRIHESVEDRSTKNKVTKSRVVFTVIFQQILQLLLGFLVLEDDENANLDHRGKIQGIQSFLAFNIIRVLGVESAHRFSITSGPFISSWLYWWGIPVSQLAFGMYVSSLYRFAAI